MVVNFIKKFRKKIPLDETIEPNLVKDCVVSRFT